MDHVTPREKRSKVELHTRIRKYHTKILSEDSKRLFDAPNVFQLLVKAQRLERLEKRGYTLPDMPDIFGPSVAYKFNLTDRQYDAFERFRRRHRIGEMGHVPDKILALYKACEQIYNIDELFNAPPVSRQHDGESRVKKGKKQKKR